MQKFNRPRRLRRTKIIRELVAETTLNIGGLIQPYFVCEGNRIKEEIKGLPGIYRESADSVVKSIAADKKPEEESYTERLLKAKKKVWENRDKK